MGKTNDGTTAENCWVKFSVYSVFFLKNKKTKQKKKTSRRMWQTIKHQMTKCLLVNLYSDMTVELLMSWPTVFVYLYYTWCFWNDVHCFSTVYTCISNGKQSWLSNTKISMRVIFIYCLLFLAWTSSRQTVFHHRLAYLHMHWKHNRVFQGSKKNMSLPIVDDVNNTSHPLLAHFLCLNAPSFKSHIWWLKTLAWPELHSVSLTEHE